MANFGFNRIVSWLGSGSGFGIGIQVWVWLEKLDVGVLVSHCSIFAGHIDDNRQRWCTQVTSTQRWKMSLGNWTVICLYNIRIITHF